MAGDQKPFERKPIRPAHVIVVGLVCVAVGWALGWTMANRPAQVSYQELINRPSDQVKMDVPDAARTPSQPTGPQRLRAVVVAVKADRLIVQEEKYEGSKLVGDKAELVIGPDTQVYAKVPAQALKAAGSPPAIGAAPGNGAPGAASPYIDVPIKLSQFKVNDLVEFPAAAAMLDGLAYEPAYVAWIAEIKSVTSSGVIQIKLPFRFAPKDGSQN